MPPVPPISRPAVPIRPAPLPLEKLDPRPRLDPPVRPQPGALRPAEAKVPPHVGGIEALTGAVKVLERVQKLPISATPEGLQQLQVASKALVESSVLLNQGRSELDRKVPAARDLGNILGITSSQLAAAGGSLGSGKITMSPQALQAAQDAAKAGQKPQLPSMTIGDVTGPAIGQALSTAKTALEMLQKAANPKATLYPGYL